jgi:ethanolamine ammonia-lyase large subunit
MIDKQDRAREAEFLLNNQTLKDAISAIEKGAIEEMVTAMTDEARRVAADRVRIVRAIPQLLQLAVEQGKATPKPRIVA